MYLKIINKLIITLIIILINLQFLKITNAFLNWWLWLDLYNNIDSWLEELNQDIFKKKINSNWSSLDNLNQFLKANWAADCMKNISIIKQDTLIEIWEIQKNIDYECYNKEWRWTNITIQDLTRYKNLINKFIQSTKSESKSKSENIFEISNIWIFSDWDINNSPFDLIYDLKEIDDIIFTNTIEYSYKDIDLLEKINKNNKNNKDEENKKKSEDNKKTNNNENNNNWLEQENIKKQDELKISGNNILCNWENLSWLDNEEIKKIFNKNYNINKLSDTNKISEYIKQENKLKNNFQVWYNWKYWYIWKYKWVNDNDIWPCNKYFCIKLSLDTYITRALDYSISNSIENILERSNYHLKKAVNTSLQQAKMSTNNFEIWLRDLNLAKQFHLGFIIKKKAPPILNLENIIKWQNKTTKEIDNNSILSHYYKNLWLDYKRVNDINIYNKKDIKTQNIINNTQLNIFSDYEWINNSNEYNTNINNSIEIEINNWILEEFYLELVELDWFIISILNYIQDLNSFIIKLKAIPQWV